MEKKGQMTDSSTASGKMRKDKELYGFLNSNTKEGIGVLWYYRSVDLNTIINQRKMA